MSIVKINPSTATKIAEGSCTVMGTNNNQLVYFTNKDELLDTSYLNDNAYIISDSPVFARSTYTELNIDVISNVSAGVPGAKGEKGATGAKGDPVLNINGNKPLVIWAGTQVEKDAIVTKDPNTVYLVKGE